MLVAGGALLALLTVIAVVNLVIQNLVGVGMMTALGQPPGMGVLAGSAALSGGHGTVLAWAPIVGSRFEIPGAAALGAAAATFGLVAGGILGGPLGHKLIERNRLSGKDASTLTVGVPFTEEDKPRLDANGLLLTLLVIAIAVAASGYANAFLARHGIVLPSFVTALFCGIVLSNVVPPLLPRLPWPSGSTPMAVISEISLGTVPFHVADDAQPRLAGRRRAAAPGGAGGAGRACAGCCSTTWCSGCWAGPTTLR